MNVHRLRSRAGTPCRMRAQSATKSDQSDAYNEKMKKAMGWKDADPYQYHYDRGLYYHEIVPDLLCGSQPRNIADVAELKEEVGATTVINVGMHGCRKLASHCILLAWTNNNPDNLCDAAVAARCRFSALGCRLWCCASEGPGAWH